MRLLFLVNNPAFFLSHRLVLGIAAKRAGMEVHVAAPDLPGADEIRRHGFRFHSIPMSRSKGSPIQEFATAVSLVRLYRRVRPDIVHHVTIKPVIYGTLAARLASVPSVVNAISGLGYVFIRQGWKAAIIRRIIVMAYRFALRHRNSKVIFQNPDDVGVFMENRILDRRQIEIIRGSGADVGLFSPSPERQGIPVVTVASRMLWDKGIGEFVEAAGIVKGRGIQARMVLVGDVDPGNPASIPADWIRSAEREGIVEWWGHRRDMPEVFAASHVVCLPSYREGLPKVLIEAAASGRPIVTTDVPGCREIVRDGVNGILVPARNAGRLADALCELLSDLPMRERLGQAGRLLAMEEFSEDIIVAQTLRIYRSLASPAAGASSEGGAIPAETGSLDPEHSDRAKEAA